MTRRIATLLCLAAAVLRAEPKPDLNSITLPTFIFDRRHAITAGAAFPVAHDGSKFLVTAYHILGPAGGLTTRIRPGDVPGELKAVAALCLGDQRTVLLAQPALHVKDARAFDAAGGEADVAFIRIADARPVPGLTLARTAAKQGDRVWLFARLLDRDRPQVYPATAIETGDKLLQYTFDDDRLNLRALSGAPVLAENGEVLAMHLAHGVQDGKLTGLATPAAAIRQRLAAALAEAAVK